MELPSESLALLKTLETSSVFPADFKRSSQVTYMRAILTFDEGEFERPKNVLMRLIDATTGEDRENNNRDCLWVRPTLAAALRSREDEPNDWRMSEALMLFAELVRKQDEGNCTSRPPTPTSLSYEPESRHQLVIAEEAIMMVRNRDQAGVKNLLERNGLEWVREKDFWIGQGGPPTDMAWMKDVKFTSSKKRNFR